MPTKQFYSIGTLYRRKEDLIVGNGGFRMIEAETREKAIEIFCMKHVRKFPRKLIVWEHGEHAEICVVDVAVTVTFHVSQPAPVNPFVIKSDQVPDKAGENAHTPQ